MWTGFFLAAYSTVSNDSIQTLGTYITSNSKTVWYLKWGWIGIIYILTTSVSWYLYDGDISYERLQSKGFDKDPEEFNYLQVAAPAILMILTRLKFPVSTSFIILTSFVQKASSMQKVILKSLVGYVISFILAAIVFIIFGPLVKKYCAVKKGKIAQNIWVVLQWTTTGILWSIWLQQDMSNIAVFLDRSLEWYELLIVLISIATGLGLLFFFGGEKIISVVEEKSRTSDVPEATLIDFLFSIVLFVFKIYSKVPMSTTWCFVGLLAGRELSLSLRQAGLPIKKAIWLSLKDLFLVTVGFIISLLIGMGANEHAREMVWNTFQ